ncbi:DUF58 domain-containing protein [Thermogymnomonas acidicola]|uniref:DUF58 domain-containing protein n=1 Tax=Thermogymnomonas acidicola TaxID=399579 RepID=UPI001396AB18|nr:DUF58 domain-containing protein [Thermogymnomonas acidicola]
MSGTRRRSRWPPLHCRRPLAEERADEQHSLHHGGVHYSRKVGQGYDFYGIREYQETDDYRYVAWSRFGMVNGEDIYIKQMEEERQLDVVFVLDYSDAANIGARDRKVFDRMVSSVINCAYSIVRNRDGVGFLLFHGGRKVLIEPRRSREPIEELERLVSGIRPAGSFNLEQAIEEAQDMVKKDALLFLISPLAHAESLNFKQRIKHRSGKRVFVFIIDPSASVEIPGSGPERRLALGVLMKHRKDLEAIRQFLAGNGVRARVVDMNHLLLAMSSEYRYGKISVPG